MLALGQRQEPFRALECDGVLVNELDNADDSAYASSNAEEYTQGRRCAFDRAPKRLERRVTLISKVLERYGHTTYGFAYPTKEF